MNQTDIIYQITGNDAAAFLQQQLTADITQIKVGQTQIAAWCTPKGTVKVIFELTRHAENDFTARFPEDLETKILPKLKLFVLRQNVIFTRISTEIISQANIVKRMQAGIARITLETTEQWIAQMLNLDQLNAIGWKKGCYPGQEILARLYWRGGLKRRLFYTEVTENIAVGSPITIETMTEAVRKNHAGEVIECVPIFPENNSENIQNNPQKYAVLAVCFM